LIVGAVQYLLRDPGVGARQGPNTQLSSERYFRYSYSALRTRTRRLLVSAIWLLDFESGGEGVKTMGGRCDRGSKMTYRRSMSETFVGTVPLLSRRYLLAQGTVALYPLSSRGDGDIPGPAGGQAGGDSAGDSDILCWENGSTRHVKTSQTSRPKPEPIGLAARMRHRLSSSNYATVTLRLSTGRTQRDICLD
jgi:hypothetical protein